jgi:hypothetical protein
MRQRAGSFNHTARYASRLTVKKALMKPFHLIFKAIGNTDDAAMGPDGRAPPFPLLDYPRVSLTDDPPDISERLAAPVKQSAMRLSISSLALIFPPKLLPRTCCYA